MTLKKFSIISAIIVGIIVVATVVLACVKVDSGLGLTPDRVIVYLNETAGTSCDETNNQTHYKKLVNLYKGMTKLSIFDYMVHGNVIDTTPGQDYDQELDDWSYSNKQDNYCLELIFKEKQSVTVKVHGNTKVVDFYGLIMIVEKSTLSHQVALYFSTTESFDVSKSYSNSPLLINANQTALWKYLDYMSTTV